MAIFNPQVMANTNGVEHSSNPMSELFLKKRIIFINGEIDKDSAAIILSHLMYLDSVSTDDIYLIINSPGGVVSDGNSIYDYIKHGCRCDVVTIATGEAASMGAFLLAAGTKGKRYATHNAEIMIHQPLGGTRGQATEMIIAVNRIVKVKEKLTQILSEECNKDYATVALDLERDHWMDASEALEYGIIDKIGFPEELLEV